MSMQQISKKCPYCKTVYEQRACGRIGRKALPEDVWTYGSPVRLCAHCKQVFVDKDVKEMAYVPPRKQDTALITDSTLTLAPVGVGVALILYVLRQPTFAYIAIGIAILYLLMDLACYPLRMRKLKREKAASEKRMSDREYAHTLKKAGVDVPDKYL